MKMITEFTPWQSLFGGILIGSAAVLLMLMLGRIAGFTGIISGLLPPSPVKDWQWRIAILTGMLAAPAAYWLLSGQTPEFQTSATPALLLFSGVLAGIGVQFASGCTSGHGVCGLSRFSIRSLAAVLTFMTTATATVFIVRHVVGG